MNVRETVIRPFGNSAGVTILATRSDCAAALPDR